MIDVSNLSKKFDGFTAVDNISFSVGEGEIFAFLGPNGAGKSTTIKMLTTLLKPNSGRISVNGFNPLTQQDDTRRSFGIVFQDQSIDEELTAYENLEFHGVLYGVDKQTRTRRIKNLMQMVDLWDRRDDYVKYYSGGMKRRLEIARGLIHHPRILFLDEPTLGLDPQTRNNIWEHIRELNLNNRMTIFFTTHYMTEAQEVANRVAIIDHGKIIILGSVEQIMDSTSTGSLEEAFLQLTGRSIREENASSMDRMRLRRRVRR
ncbi:MAG: multidrug ABC transporter ATP-binding protein [Candidatus Altiarchaeales archaeon ex4484_96]|nr:MAG: multidrug ABC transporter ATP-binding protein [Candidatus Altiarchaeales archaeon ex4484_96]